MTTIVEYNSTDLIVSYELDGQYYPETRETPAEYPEIIIKSITVEDSEIDLQELLGWEVVDEIINLIEI